MGLFEDAMVAHFRRASVQEIPLLHAIGLAGQIEVTVSHGDQKSAFDDILELCHLSVIKEPTIKS